MSELRKRRDRYPTSLAARIERPDGAQSEALMTDISHDGFCIATNETLPIGERVELFESRIGTLRGRVRWSFQGRAGCRFDNGPGSPSKS